MSSPVISYYRGSVHSALTDLFPGFSWKGWLQSATPHNYWDVESNKESFFDWLGREMKIRRLNDWYKVTADDMLEKGAPLYKFNRYAMLFLFQYDYDMRLDLHIGIRSYRSPITALSSAFPYYNWQAWRFSHPPQSIFDLSPPCHHSWSPHYYYYSK